MEEEEGTGYADVVGGHFFGVVVGGDGGGILYMRELMRWKEGV